MSPPRRHGSRDPRSLAAGDRMELLLALRRPGGRGGGDRGVGRGAADRRGAGGGGFRWGIHCRRRMGAAWEDRDVQHRPPDRADDI